MIPLSKVVKTVGPLGGFKVISKMTQGYPRILMYHRFSKNLTEGSVSFSTLEDQFKYLKKNFEVVSLDEVVTNYFNNRLTVNYNKPLVSITVDDGYRDFYDICYPLLKIYNFPATFYVATDFVGNKDWLWHDKLKWLFDNGQGLSESFDLGGTIYDTDTWNKCRKSLWPKFVSILLGRPANEIMYFLETLASLTNLKIPRTPPDEYCAVSWDQLREMERNQISIGGHTMTHFSLGYLSDEDARNQILGCKDQLDRELGISSRHFCFPNGQQGDISQFAKDTIQEVGFKSAVAAYYDKTGISDRFSMSRHGIGESWFEFQKSVWGVDRLGAILLNRNSKFDWGHI